MMHVSILMSPKRLPVGEYGASHSRFEGLFGLAVYLNDTCGKSAPRQWRFYLEPGREVEEPWYQYCKRYTERQDALEKTL
jgi:hypothetical protein